MQNAPETEDSIIPGRGPWSDKPRNFDILGKLRIPGSFCELEECGNHGVVTVGGKKLPFNILIFIFLKILHKALSYCKAITISIYLP